MKAIRRSATRLDIELKGEGLILGLFGLFLLLGGVLAFYFLGQRTILTCERVESFQIDCTLKKQLLSVTLDTEALHALEGARLEESWDDEGDLMYRVWLTTREGAYPLTTYKSSSRRKHAADVHAINQFLQSNKASLKLTSGGTLGLMLGATFLLVGLALIVFGLQTYFTLWTFDRETGKVCCQQEKLTGIKVRTWDLQDITDVQLSSKIDSEGDRTYTVTLHHRYDGTIPLTFSSSGRRGKTQVAQAVRDFLAQP